MQRTQFWPLSSQKDGGCRQMKNAGVNLLQLPLLMFLGPSMVTFPLLMCFRDLIWCPELAEKNMCELEAEAMLNECRCCKHVMVLQFYPFAGKLVAIITLESLSTTSQILSKNMVNKIVFQQLIAVDGMLTSIYCVLYVCYICYMCVICKYWREFITI